MLEVGRVRLSADLARAGGDVREQIDSTQEAPLPLQTT